MTEQKPVTTKQPPQMTEQLKEDVRSIFLWAHDLYKALVIEQRLAVRLKRAADVALLTQAISNPPTKAECEALQEKINELITALK